MNDAKIVAITKPLIENVNSAEEFIAYCARVSNPNNQMNNETAPKLLKYCLKNKHWSIFEMINIVMAITTTRDIARQILRHRSFSFQEFCVAGDTEIYFDLPGKVKTNKKRLYKKQIKDLYNSWTSSSHKKQQIQKMMVRIYNADTGLIEHANIKEIFFTGVKPVFKITLENGKTITCTKDHKFLSENGFDSLENLIGLKTIGNTTVMSKQASIATNGIAIYRDKEWLSLAKERSIKNKTGVQGIAEEAEVSYDTIKKWLKIHNLSFTKNEVAQYTDPWNRGVFGYKLSPKSEEVREKHRKSAKKGAESNLWKGGVNRSFRLQVAGYIGKYRNKFLKNANYQCSKCNSNNKLELHHIIPVYKDKSKAFDLDNIEVVCSKCHDKIHGIDRHMPKGAGNKLTKKFSSIKLVEYVGEQDTYDLEINHKSHNYVANGIITHNSQRYADPTKTLGFSLKEARLQDKKNRQNSIEIHDDELEAQWKNVQMNLIQEANYAYDWAVSKGIAKEQARAVLPEGLINSTMYMSGSLRSWIHWIQVRNHPSTQKEHRYIAESATKEIITHFPILKDSINEMIDENISTNNQ